MRPDHFTIIPVKPFEEGKSRLATILSIEERRQLSASFFGHTLSLAEALNGLASTIVVSRSNEVLEVARSRGARALRESRVGLNEAIGQATRFALCSGARSVLILPTDLPLATAPMVRELMADDAPGTMVIVSDRSRVGTNLLFLSPPQFDRYCFGPVSYDRHRKAAAASDLRVIDRRMPELEFDIDTPEDYRLWRRMMEARRGSGSRPGFDVGALMA